MQPAHSAEPETEINTFYQSQIQKNMSKRTSQSKIQNILPELHLLLRASIDDQRYHRVTFDTLEALRKLLTENQGILNVKRKAGCLSYKDDPQGTVHILHKH